MKELICKEITEMDGHPVLVMNADKENWYLHVLDTYGDLEISISRTPDATSGIWGVAWGRMDSVKQIPKELMKAYIRGGIDCCILGAIGVKHLLWNRADGSEILYKSFITRTNDWVTAR